MLITLNTMPECVHIGQRSLGWEEEQALGLLLQHRNDDILYCAKL